MKSLITMGFNDDGKTKMERNLPEEEQKQSKKTVVQERTEEEDEYMTDLVPFEEDEEEEEEIMTGTKTINEFFTSHYKNIDRNKIFDYVYDPINGVRQVIVERENKVEA
jgi:hypothetical protein